MRRQSQIQSLRHGQGQVTKARQPERVLSSLRQSRADLASEKKCVRGQ